jgi:class 3 adenylate cyclase/tetratricopeptide (TPR) repeat protein
MERTDTDPRDGDESVAAQPINLPLALVFTDMVGSSAAKRAASLGGSSVDRDAAFLESIQSRHLRLIRECVAEHRGKEIMTIGDSFFLTFDDPRSALLCAAEIQMRLKAQPIMTANGRLQLRIGIHVGTPQYFENSWHGTDVDTAARTEAAGSPDQIILTEAAQRAIGELPGVPLRSLGTYELKGVGEVKLVDADYDGAGLRKPRVDSLEDLKRRKRLTLARNAAAVLLVTCLAVGGYFLLRPRPKIRITDQDKIIVADFDNKTGDPVFDSTLKEALYIQLAQSPYLLLVSDSELHSDLRYLNQPVNQKITAALAREIGQREGIKAYLTGSVASLGGAYVVSLNAVNCATGEVFAREQVQAPDKPHVLTAVSTAATSMRAQLGESLASIQKLSSPYTEVTTASLKAFHAFSLGEEQHAKGRGIPEAEGYYKQAIDLDPTFAMAYARLGVVYSNVGLHDKAVWNLNKALALSNRTTERERIYIASETAMQQEDMPKALELYRQYTTAYPRETSAWNNLAIAYTYVGELEQAAQAYEKAYELAKGRVVAASNAASTLLAIDRLPEARHYLDEVRAAGAMDTDVSSMIAMMTYLFQSGSPDWRGQIQLGVVRRDGSLLDEAAGNIDLAQGRLADARDDMGRAVRRAQAAKLNELAGNSLSVFAIAEAQFGDCRQGYDLARRALALDLSVATVPNASLALALCGHAVEGLSTIQKLAKENPANTLVSAVFLPEVQAAAALAQHRPDQVNALLQDVEHYGPVSYVPYLEGVAALQQKKPADAVAALAPGRRWRGVDLQLGNGGSPQATLYGVDLLLTARAQALAGSHADAIKTYQQALEEWKNADPDFRPANDAGRELAALTKGSSD